MLLFFIIVSTKNYKVVTPPEGIIVTYLPDDAKTEYVGGTRYHVYAGVYYAPVLRGDTIVYRVIQVKSS